MDLVSAFLFWERRFWGESRGCTGSVIWVGYGEREREGEGEGDAVGVDRTRWREMERETRLWGDG